MIRSLMMVLFAGCVGVMAKPAQDDTVSCAVAASDRVECGWFGITKEICLARGCCWDSSTSNAKYCFVKKGIHKRLSCYIYHGVNGICRYTCKPGESKMYGMAQCKGTVCCYTTPWSK